MSVTAVPIRPIKKGSLGRFWIALLLLALVAGAAAWLGTRGYGWNTTASGLQYRVIEEGQGASPAETDIATFDYEGRLADGTVFDSSEGKGPAQIPVFGVVPGFAEGLQLMNKGAHYRFRLPPELGYGEQGAPPAIPPGATIEFDVTLRDFRSLTPQELEQVRMMQMLQQMQQQGGAEAPQGQAAPPRGE